MSEIEHALHIVGHHMAPHAVETVKENSGEIVEKVVEVGKAIIEIIFG